MNVYVIRNHVTDSLNVYEDFTAAYKGLSWVTGVTREDRDQIECELQESGKVTIDAEYGHNCTATIYNRNTIKS